MTRTLIEWELAEDLIEERPWYYLSVQLPFVPFYLDGELSTASLKQIKYRPDQRIGDYEFVYYGGQRDLLRVRFLG
jgi:hypothetical protein